MIGIVNYGLGNVQAFANIYKRLNIEAGIASSVKEVLSAERLILPGVGAFDWAMRRLDNSGLREALEEAVVHKCKPVLGVCVGMQMMANGSEEGILKGLGWIDADVKKFSVEVSKSGTQLPHMGWNDVEPRNGDGLFRGLEKYARFYFLHSYYFLPKSPENVLAVTEYNGSYTSSVRSGNVYGVQFHPEKSHGWGTQLLKNFAEL